MRQCDWTRDELLPAREVLLSGGTGTDAAKALGVSRKTIVHLQGRGKLPRGLVTRGRGTPSDPKDVRIARLECALRACIARAGWPDPVEACRLVIKTASAALGN